MERKCEKYPDFFAKKTTANLPSIYIMHANGSGDNVNALASM